MHSLFNIFLSNRVETLFTGFKELAFASSHPLSKRLVIVPSAAMKSWLMQQMAKDSQLGIAAGLEINYVEPTLNRLHTMMVKPSPLTTEYNEPTEIELALALENTMGEVAKMFHSLPLVEQRIWQPLLSYLGHTVEQGAELSRRVTKRIGALALTLAKLFIDYGKYGGAMIAQWEKERSSGWQQLLWYKMESQFNRWTFPYRKFEEIEIESSFQPEELQIHVFGLSYLAPVHHRFLIQLSEHVPVNYYMLSPCQKFWSDLLSEKESVRLQKYWHRKQVATLQQDILADYLRDNNPLLANFGRLGREMAALLEKNDFMIEEQYVLPQAVQNEPCYAELLNHDLVYKPSLPNLSLLDAVQADIVLLRNPEFTEKVAVCVNDGTIQIHAAPKPMREVEVLHHVMMSLIEKHANDTCPLMPGDIVVMAPNLATYEPFIRAVFESPQSSLDIHLMDLNIPSQNSFIQGFLHLLSLPFSRWDALSLMRLFEFPAFREHHRIKIEDVQVIHQWIKEAGIRWGKDANHRMELLKRDHCINEPNCGINGQGTWEEGLGRLLEGLVMRVPEESLTDEFEFRPLERIEGNQGELLGIFLRLSRSLLSDLKPLVDDTKLTISDWAIYLKSLCEAYFDHKGGEEQENGYQLLVEQFIKLGQSAKCLKGVKFAFHSIWRHLENVLQATTSHYRESNLQAVRFCSLLPMRAVPAKVVILMGMSEGEFPRHEQGLSLNLLTESPSSDYCPSQTDFDRYLFLEALLSARQYFIVSYVSQLPGNPQIHQPSLLVKELTNYIDKVFASSNEQYFYRHPLLSFHRCYFEKNSPFKNYFKNDFRKALVHYNPVKKEVHSFFNAFEQPLLEMDFEEGLIQVNLAELTAFTKNPLKIYFNKTLGIYLESLTDKEVKTDDELLVSFLDRAIMLKEAVHSSTDNLLTRATKAGKFPLGPFREIEIERMHEDATELKQNLLSHGISDEHMMTIDFKERYQEVKSSTEGWQVPPLIIEVPRFGKVQLVGLLEHVSPSGLVAVEKDLMEDAIKVWPMWLAYCCLVKKYQLPLASQLILAKGKKGSAKPAAVEDPEKLLGRFLEYYFMGLMSPSPLLPECVSPYLRGNFEKVHDVFKEQGQDEFKPVYDEYLKWIKRSSPQLDLERANLHWQKTAEDLFVDMHNAWYAKKT